MTRNDSYSDLPPLTEAVDRVVATYGALPVLLRALRAAIRSKRPPPTINTDALPDHLRRDIGFDPHVRRTPDRIFRL